MSRARAYLLDGLAMPSIPFDVREISDRKIIGKHKYCSAPQTATKISIFAFSFYLRITSTRSEKKLLPNAVYLEANNSQCNCRDSVCVCVCIIIRLSFLCTYRVKVCDTGIFGECFGLRFMLPVGRKCANCKRYMCPNSKAVPCIRSMLRRALAEGAEHLEQFTIDHASMIVESRCIIIVHGHISAFTY